MPLFYIPDRIRITVDLGDATLKLANRLIDLVEGDPRKFGAASNALDASTNRLQDVVAATPQPK